MPLRATHKHENRSLLGSRFTQRVLGSWFYFQHGISLAVARPLPRRFPMTQLGTSVDELDTPCLLVDLDRMEANIRAWQATIGATGAGLRPHVKTHKVPAIAQMQLDAGATGITVAKVGEAEVFADGGCRDIFIAYPVIGAEKWRRAAELARRCTLTVGVDSEAGARGLSAAAA